VPGVRIVTDSACDLPPEVSEENQIDIVPLTIRFGEEELLDRRDLTPEQFWARCASSPRLPETAARSWRPTSGPPPKGRRGSCA